MLKERGIEFSGNEGLMSLSKDILTQRVVEKFHSPTFAEVIMLVMVGTERRVPENIMEAVLSRESKEQNIFWLKQSIDHWNQTFDTGNARNLSVIKELALMNVVGSISDIGSFSPDDSRIRQLNLSLFVSAIGPEIIGMLDGRF